MPVFYNPLGTRAVITDNIQLAAGANTVFAFNGIVHFHWQLGAPSNAYFEMSTDGGVVWTILITFLAGDVANSIMVSNGTTRIRRQAAGVGNWPIRLTGWRFN